MLYHNSILKMSNYVSFHDDSLFCNGLFLSPIMHPAILENNWLKSYNSINMVYIRHLIHSQYQFDAIKMADTNKNISIGE